MPAATGCAYKHPVTQPDTDLELLDLRAHRDLQLLQTFYQELYLPAFPIESEREDPTIWAPLLWPDPAAPGKSARMHLHIVLAGLALADPAARQIKGAVVFELYRQSHTALLTYILVHPSQRRHGLGRVGGGGRRSLGDGSHRLTALPRASPPGSCSYREVTARCAPAAHSNSVVEVPV